MPRCDTCGNNYDRILEITHQGRRGVFDCFECAIHAMAPTCAHCQCRIIGHGLEVGNKIFCCAHCIRESGLEAPGVR